MKASRIFSTLFLVWTGFWFTIGGGLTLLSIVKWCTPSHIAPAGRWMGEGYNARFYTFGDYFGFLLMFLFVFFIIWLVGALALGIPAIILKHSKSVG